MQRLLVAVLALTLAWPLTAQNYSDTWWNPTESGWGLIVADHDTALVAVWYTYDADRRPTWFTLSGDFADASKRRWSGQVFRSRGPSFDQPFATAAVATQVVGSADIDFAPSDGLSGSARLRIVIGATTIDKPIERLRYGTASARYGYDLNDIWWNASQSGWGLTVSQQGGTQFATWFTYDRDGAPIWVLLDARPNALAIDTTLSYFTGPPYSQPYASAPVQSSVQGDARLLRSGDVLSLQRNFRGATQTTELTRFGFGNVPSGTPSSDGLYRGDQWPHAVARIGADSCLRLMDTERSREVTVQVRYPDAPTGPRPVIVFSHGGGPREPCSFGNGEWGETLASAGYVVVHLAHSLNAAQQSAACQLIGLAACSQEEAMRQLRPGDARFVVAQLDQIVARLGLAARTDTLRVAMAGHSFGAYTAMTVAGARYDLGALRSVSSGEPQLHSVLALSPQGPDRFGFYDRGASHSWAGIGVPVMTQTGLADSTSGEDAASRRVPFQRMPAPDKIELFLNDPRAQHNTFNLEPAAGAPELSAYIKSSAIAWFDATLLKRSLAYGWLESQALASVSAGRAVLSRREILGPGRSPPAAARTPDSRFVALPEFDYAPRYIDIDGLRMHFIDVGPPNATPVLLLHGQPSWSYLYRKMIPVLVAGGYRVVAPDLIGFGRSDKPLLGSDYSVARHQRQLTQFIERLDLRQIHAFMQDWGSIIGLRIVAAQPRRFARVAVGDATLQNNPPFAPINLPIETLSGSNANPFFPAPYLPLYSPEPSPVLVYAPNWNQWRAWVSAVQPFYASVALQQMTVNDLPPGVLAAYDAPFPSAAHQAGARGFPFLAGSEPEADSLAWNGLVRFNKPFLTIYGDTDNIIGNTAPMFHALVPGAVGQPHALIRNTGHFLQEDNGELIARRMLEWFAR